MIRTLFLSVLLAIATVGMTTVLATGPVQAAEMKTVTLDVQNMTCNFCPITVRKALEKVPGVVKATASLETKSATVTFDPTKTNVEALTKATADAGYPSTLKAK
ncbi:MAG: mercury resistance system periplasmic binding protein MerP [Gammaproteobacteria bacterium]|nr:MAG: mercury resistance system periplasmic binding protein MerP [Gammaproteobacteria bacterium]